MRYPFDLGMQHLSPSHITSGHHRASPFRQAPQQQLGSLPNSFGGPADYLPDGLQSENPLWEPGLCASLPRPPTLANAEM